ncbi:PKD domain-containing protein [Hydrogenimonas thermophila]|uniref:PKD domain-containing protein n=1 Tax=Hydrogenimonas thermophila TaxID=223786 RepID=UPI002936DCA2|nr:PKD domain-containing protein [Hydrogenimonas thermophila]WOE69577.1 PKD domain-containing protein [Hydrogenimonas thermophila]WOE72091.1 PKD domain-containing protein [Hydrogenimonas thermophila]
MKKIFSIFLFFISFILQDAVASQSTYILNNWKIDFAYNPKFIKLPSQRSVTVDSNNTTHIVYGGDKLYHAFFDGITWHYEIIDDNLSVGSKASIAIDSNDKLYVSYFDAINNSIKFATNNGGIWTSDFVYSKEYIYAVDTSIAVEADGTAHISFIIDGNLSYATNSSGSWDITNIDENANTFSSIVVDANDSIHISYDGIVGGDVVLRYATNSGGSWQSETVDSTANAIVGEYSSIAVDSKNIVHISYASSDENGYYYIRHAKKDSDWQIDTVSTATLEKKSYTSIAIDKNDTIYISYLYNYHTNSGALKLADFNGTDWSINTLDENIDYGQIFDVMYEGSSDYNIYTSLITDNNNKVHLTYLSQNNLKYISNVSDSWVQQTVDSGKDIGRYSTITVDNYGKYHIAYLDNYDIYSSLSTSLKLISENEANETTVDRNIDTVKSGLKPISNIRIDENNISHIVYLTFDGNLTYASVGNNSLDKQIIKTGIENSNVRNINIDKNSNVYMLLDLYDSNINEMNLTLESNLSGDFVQTVIDHNSNLYAGNLDIDDEKKFHIVYLIEDQIWYATDKNGSIVKENTGYTTYYEPVITVDKNQSVHIVYVANPDINEYEVIYLTNKDGNWTKEIVNLTSNSDLYIESINVDSNAKVHITYMEGNELLYASNRQGEWSVENIEPGANGVKQFFESYVTFNKDDEVYISYYDYYNRALKYAKHFDLRLDLTNIERNITSIYLVDENGSQILLSGSISDSNTIILKDNIPYDHNYSIRFDLNDSSQYWLNFSDFKLYINKDDTNFTTKIDATNNTLFLNLDSNNWYSFENVNKVHLYNIRKRISLQEYDDNQSIFYQLPLNLYWIDGYIDENGYYDIDTGKVALEDEIIREIKYNFTNTSITGPVYHNNLSFNIDEQNVVTVYESNESDTYSIMEVKLVNILESELLQSVYSENYIDFNFSNDAKGYLTVKKILKDDFVLIGLEKDYDNNNYTSIDTFINDRNSSGKMAIYFNELNSSKYLVFENNTSGILMEKDIYGNIINSNAGSWIRLSDKTYRYNEDDNLTYANSPDIIVLMPNVEGYIFDENAFALSSHDGGFVYRSIYKSVGDTEMEIMLNAAARDDILNQVINSTLWPKIENIHINADNSANITLPKYSGSYDNTISLDPETAIATLIYSNTTLKVSPTNKSVGETTILLQGENNESLQFITVFVDPIYINLSLLNINLSEHNITNIQIVGVDGNYENFSIDPNLINNIYDGDMNISAPVYNPDNNFSIRIDLEENQTLSYWYNFSDGKLYSENNGSNDFKTVINSTNNLFTIDLNSSNWISIPIWHLESNETTIVEDSTSFEIPLIVEGVEQPLDDSNFEVTVSDPSIVDVVIEDGVLIVTPKPNQSGTITLTLKVDVNGITDTVIYTVYIQEQNDAPSISLIDDILKPVNFDDFNISLDLNDIEGDDLNLSIESSNTSLVDINKTWNTQWLTQADYNSPIYIQVSSKPDMEGNTTITLTLFDEEGASDTQSFNLQVVNALDIISNKTVGTAPLDINLSYYLNPLFGSVESIYWELGDGTSVDGNSYVLHVYKNPGNYEVKCTVITDSGYTIKKSLNIVVTEGNLSVALNEGWNFISLPVKASLHSQDLNTTFGKPSIKYIFKYLGNRWALWDNTNEISNSVKIDRFEDLNSKEGFVVKTTTSTTILFSLDELQNDPDDFATLYTSGWYLVGVNEDKTPEQIDTLINSQNKVLKILYLYKNNQWFVYTPNSEIDNLIGDSLPRVENNISRYESFWIYVE